MDASRHSKLSGHALAAAFACGVPTLAEAFVPPGVGIALELASVALTAGIVAHAAVTVGGVRGFVGARALLREALPHAPEVEGGASLRLLRVVCGIETPLHALGCAAMARLPASVGAMLTRKATAAIPGVGVALQGARAVKGAFDAAALVHTVEAIVRRVTALDEAARAVRPIALPSTDVPANAVAA